MKETNLIYYFGKSPELKVLDFLMENKRASWNISEIEEQGQIARSTIKAVIPRLLKLKLIFVENNYGKIKLYQINKDNPIVKRLMKLSDFIDKFEFDKRP